MKTYIDNFQDLNYEKIILQLGPNICKEKLFIKLEEDSINHLNRFATAITSNNMIYIENTDLQDVNPRIINELISNGYVVKNLYFDSKGYYIKGGIK